MTDKKCKVCLGDGFIKKTDNILGWPVKLPCPNCNPEAYRELQEKINDAIKEAFKRAVDDSLFGRLTKQDRPPVDPGQLFSSKLPPASPSDLQFYMGPLDAEYPHKKSDEWGNEWVEIEFKSWAILPIKHESPEDDGDPVNLDGDFAEQFPNGITLEFKGGFAESSGLSQTLFGSFRAATTEEWNAAREESICPECGLRTLGPEKLIGNGQVILRQCANCNATIAWPNDDEPDRRLID